MLRYIRVSRSIALLSISKTPQLRLNGQHRADPHIAPSALAPSSPPLRLNGCASANSAQLDSSDSRRGEEKRDASSAAFCIETNLGRAHRQTDAPIVTTARRRRRTAVATTGAEGGALASALVSGWRPRSQRFRASGFRLLFFVRFPPPLSSLFPVRFPARKRFFLCPPFIRYVRPRFFSLRVSPPEIRPARLFYVSSPIFSFAFDIVCGVAPDSSAARRRDSCDGRQCWGRGSINK